VTVHDVQGATIFFRRLRRSGAGRAIGSGLAVVRSNGLDAGGGGQSYPDGDSVIRALASQELLTVHGGAALGCDGFAGGGER
jgi:hypothetical protein